MFVFIETILKIRPAILGFLLKTIIPFRRRMVKTPYGDFKVDIVSNFGYKLLKTKTYEEGTINILRKNIKLGDVFVDLGANEGFFTVIGSKLVGEGRVVSIEPLLKLNKIITQNVELNDCKNVTLAPVAVSNKIGKDFFYVYPNINTGASSLILPTSYFLRKIKVRTITLKALFDEFGLDHADLIKIDIEGGEYNAIFGSEELFRKKIIRKIVLELHPKLLAKQGKSTGQIIQFLTDCGYSKDDLFIL